jgi:cell division protein FtsB
MAAFGGPLVLFFVLTSIAVAPTISYYMKNKEGKMLDSMFLLWTPSLVLIVLTLCAIIIMVWLLICAEITPKKHRTRDKNFVRRWLEVNLILIGLMLFFVAFVLLDVIGMVADCKCVGSVFSFCGNIHVKVFRALEICYRPVRILFALAAVSFCCKLRNRKLVRCNTSLIGLAVMQSATLGLWVDSLIDESLHVSQASNCTQSMYANACSLEIAGSNYFKNESYRCITMESEMYQLLQTASPYLFPCSIEFLLLFAKGIAGWFFNSVRPEEERPLLEQNEIANAEGEKRQAVDEQQVLYEFRFPWFALAILLSIVGNVVFLSMGIAACYSEHDSKLYNKVFSVYRIGYWIVLTSSAIFGYFLTKRFVTQRLETAAARLPYRRTKVTGFEYFVTSCISGQVVFLALTMIANIGTNEEISPTVFYLFEEVLNLVEVIAQIVFYFYAKRVAAGMMNPCFRPEWPSRLFLVKKKYFEMSLILLVVSNFTLYVEDSFVETRSIEKSFQKNFYADWPFIYNVFNPIILLYRFNSILLFTKLYLKQPKKSQFIAVRASPREMPLWRRFFPGFLHSRLRIFS